MLLLSPLLVLGCTSGDDGFGGEGTAYESVSILEFAAGRPTNVLMITWDTTRKDRLGPFDPAGSDHTPVINALFEDSFVLDDHRSCSNWTYASVFCFQAGMRGTEAGFIASTDQREQLQVPTSLVLAPEVLQDAGYQTALAVTNPWFTDSSKLNQGFDTTVFDYDGPANWTTDVALGFFEDGTLDPDEPWFVDAHYLDPHIAYKPPEQYLDGLDDLDPIEWDLSNSGGHYGMIDAWPDLSAETQALVLEHLWVRYRGELAFVDAETGRLLETLAAAGHLDDTLVVFWADHGEQFFEHGHSGHSYDLYEDENRSVVALSAPGLTPGVWTRPTTHPDVWPTILDILEIAPDESWTGEVLGARGSTDARFAQRRSDEPPLMMVERSNTKLLYRFDGTKELYRLGGDPDEQSNVYDAEDAEVEALWALLLPEIEAMVGIWPDPAPVDPGP